MDLVVCRLLLVVAECLAVGGREVVGTDDVMSSPVFPVVSIEVVDGIICAVGRSVLLTSVWDLVVVSLDLDVFLDTPEVEVFLLCEDEEVSVLISVAVLACGSLVVSVLSVGWFSEETEASRVEVLTVGAVFRSVVVRFAEVSGVVVITDGELVSVVTRTTGQRRQEHKQLRNTQGTLLQ